MRDARIQVRSGKDEGREGLQVGSWILLFKALIKFLLGESSMLQISVSEVFWYERGEEKAERPELVHRTEESSTRDTGEDEFDPWLLAILTFSLIIGKGK